MGKTDGSIKEQGMENTKDLKTTLEYLFENNLRMENSILKTMIDLLLRQCPETTYKSCFNAAILEMVKENRKESEQ